MVEQIITEFFAKSSILSSGRVVQPGSRGLSAALENMDLWGVGESNFAPLVIDVILVRRPSDLDQTHRPPAGVCLEQDEPGTERREKIIERWVVQYESRNSGGCAGMAEPSSGGRGRTTSGSSHSSEMSAAQRKVYKRSIILLRSLYLTVRLLPAYKIFRDLVSTGQVLPFSLAHRISSFVEPFTRVEDEEMQQYAFSPIDTPCGRLCLSVSYLPTLEDLSSEPWTPLSAQLISDYVGSPLADPLKRFECLPSAVPIPTYVSFTRRHSWSNSHRSTPLHLLRLHPPAHAPELPASRRIPSFLFLGGGLLPSPPDCRFQAKPESLQGRATNSGNLLGGLMAACTSPRLLPNTATRLGYLCWMIEKNSWHPPSLPPAIAAVCGVLHLTAPSHIYMECCLCQQPLMFRNLCCNPNWVPFTFFL
ncbi:unnamed protein product [Spirodela intermedia]|uniref:Autophagy-related protein 13 N-terminal domain-containing protein n=1 Tax=Spirodela intermedia TaxID=51605 RepID=A0A7I8JF61_SPIIN|nr:unnamed protein product [Spirodela intermedia]CAA6668385.1 unnamed protein product [Spirodela intermedia]